MFTELPFTDLTPKGYTALSLLGLNPVPDACTSSRGLDNAKPVPARHVFGRGDNLDNVSIYQFVFERHQLAVYLGPGALIAYFCVNAVGEIDWRGAAWKGLHLSIWGKHVDFIRKKIQSDCLEEFSRVFEVLLPF